MSPRGGINGVDSISASMVSYGLPTIEMLGDNLTASGLFLYFPFYFAENLYPRIDLNYIHPVNHPIDLISAAPAYLDGDETVDEVVSHFYVSNHESNYMNITIYGYTGIPFRFQ